MDPKIALLLTMERSVWDQTWQNLTGLTEEEYRWRPLPQANDINWILRHLAGYERYCGNIVRGVDVGREHWPDAPTQGSRARTRAPSTQARLHWRRRNVGDAR